MVTGDGGLIEGPEGTALEVPKGAFPDGTIVTLTKIAEANFPQPKRFKRIGIPDVFPDQYGSQASLMERYNITAANLARTVEQLHKR